MARYSFKKRRKRHGIRNVKRKRRKKSRKKSRAFAI